MAECAERGIHFFRELLSCAHDLYSWVYNDRREIIYSNCPHEAAFNNIFLADSNSEALQPAGAHKPRPAVITNHLGLMWIAEFETAGPNLFIHVLGPVFYGDVSAKAIDQALGRMGLSIALKGEFMKILEDLPVVSVTRMMEYGLMLHYTLTGEKISPSDLLYIQKPQAAIQKIEPGDIDRHGTWRAEQGLLKLVEDGNLNYRKERDRLAAVGTVGKLSANDPIRQIKNQIIIYTALCTRAAVRGGLFPETAYTVSDQYIVATEESKTLGELMDVCEKMQDDFIRRVHQAKLQAGMSQQVKACRDYIQLHITEKLSVAAIAAQAGYTESYLSKKFKRETGQCVTEYINAAKVEYAKGLLADCDVSIQEIAERLSFGTQSYFCEQFKKYAGVTAGEYRKGNHTPIQDERQVVYAETGARE
jgi:AraC-like DNA-binding protein